MNLPKVCVQDTFGEVLSDLANGKCTKEECWVEINGKELRFPFTASPTTQSATDPDYTAFVSPAAFDVEIRHRNSPVALIRLGELRADIKKYAPLAAADVFGTRALLGRRNGELLVLDTENDEVKQLEGHIMHTSVSKFFPSGEVALSAGMDYQIKLWDLNSGTKIQSLMFQKGLVNDVAFIDRGRNLLSLCEQDNTVALWEVSKPLVVNEYAIEDPQCLSVYSGAPTNTPQGEGKYGTDGKVCLVGHKSGISLVDLRADEVHTGASSPCSHIAINQHQVISCHKNQVSAHDIRNFSTKIFSLKADFGPDHDQDIQQIETTSSKLYIRTSYTTFGFDYSTQNVEVLASDNGLLVSAGDLYTVGDSLRCFPL